ncbi:uncharacterized protein LOC134287489 [Aedes albopictus]|uniref:OTU domain-containing protein n=1 Tax=Aedes albopictus TaxID=7160 RepID=A0ABM1ZKU9_AEDAL
MRQKDDLGFVIALNNFARGEMSNEDVKIIKSREVEEHQVPDEAIRLHYTNANVDKYNEKKISESSSTEIECIAMDTITGKLKPNQKIAKMKMWKERPTKDCGGYPYTIRFKQGIKYMLTANLDVSDGLVNGATGVLEHVFCNPGLGKPIIVFLKFDSSNVGKKIRQQYRNFMENNNINLSWTPIPRKVYNLTTHFQKDYQMIRDQFPIVPCEALTIHKSQGQTYRHVCIDFRKSGNLTRQLVYVELSRVTSLSGLYILGNFPGNMKSNNTIDACLNEMDRLRKERSLSLVYNNLVNVSGLKVVYLNIRSLRANKKHVDVDPWYFRCDILIFSETCLYANEQIEFPGFNLVYRSDTISYPDYVKKNIAKGIICFVRSSLKANVVDYCTEFKADQKGHYHSHIDLVKFVVNEIQIISGYKSPKVSVCDFKDTMLRFQLEESCPTIVIGDFNFNLNDTRNAQIHEFSSFMINHSYVSKLSPTEATTILGSRLDIVYANFENITAGVYECYFSDHKPIYCIICSKQSCLYDVNKIGNDNIQLFGKSSDLVSIDSKSIASCVDLSSEDNSIRSSNRNINSLSFQYSDFESDLDHLNLENNIKDWINSVDTTNDAYDNGNEKLLKNIQQVFYNDPYTFTNSEELLIASTDANVMRYKSDIDHIANYLMALPTNIFKCNRDRVLSVQTLNGFLEIPITGDGGCQFNAISYALVGNESFSFDLRAIAFQAVIENIHLFDKIKNTIGLESDTLFNLLQICCSERLFGNLDTLFALSMALERIILIMLHHENGEQRFVKVEPPSYSNTDLPILLHLTRPGQADAHYNVLLPSDVNTPYDFTCYDVYNLNHIVMS